MIKRVDRVLTQNQRQLRRREEQLQAAVQEGQQVVRVRRAEPREKLRLPAANRRRLGPVEPQNLMGHLQKNHKLQTRF